MNEDWLHSGMKLKLQQIKLLLDSLPSHSSVSITKPLHLNRELFTDAGFGTLVKAGHQIGSILADLCCGSCQPFIWHLSGSCQAVVWQLSVSRLAVVRQSSGSCLAFDRQLSVSHPAVVRQSSGSHSAVYRKSFVIRPAVIQ